MVALCNGVVVVYTSSCKMLCLDNGSNCFAQAVAYSNGLLYWGAGRLPLCTFLQVACVSLCLSCFIATPSSLPNNLVNVEIVLIEFWKLLREISVESQGSLFS